MKFSIITPSFNQGRFIRDCIESVRAQEGEGVETEHIVIDACSKDETVSVLQSHPDLQWVSEPDKGQTDAINKGFRKATGDWLMWLNADDYLLPGALAKVQAHAAQHGEAEIIYGDCLFVEENGKVIRRRWSGDYSLNALLFYGCFIPSTAAFYRRSLIDAGFLLDDSYKVCMDFEYYARLACAGRQFSYLRKALACFRWHETNVSTVYGQRRYEERLKVQREALGKLARPAWLGREAVLKLLQRGYMAKRAASRKLRGLS